MFLNASGKEWYVRQIDEFNKIRPSYKKYEIFLEKAIRKFPKRVRTKELTTLEQWNERFDPAHEFTDLCGIRAITATQYEIRTICRFIRNNFAIDEVPSEDKRAILKYDQFGYTSVHYIVQPHDWKDILGVPIPEQLGQR